MLHAREPVPPCCYHHSRHRTHTTPCYHHSRHRTHTTPLPPRTKRHQRLRTVVCGTNSQACALFGCGAHVAAHINNLFNTCFWALVLKGNMTEVQAEQELKVTIVAIVTTVATVTIVTIVAIVTIAPAPSKEPFRFGVSGGQVGSARFAATTE